MRKSFITDLEECKRLWNRLIPSKNLFDLWEFRLCFQRHFRHKPYFLLLEDRKSIAGMVPLSYVEDLDIFVFFPGETWKGKTWIERTPIYLREQSLLAELPSFCPERTYLRYMEVSEEAQFPDLEIDEIGYVLDLHHINFDLDVYGQRFSNKKFKAIMKVIKSFSGAESAFHLNRLEDLEVLISMSLERFGSASYLYDRRFRDGFRDLVNFLYDKGCLRMISLEIDGKTAAVDTGALFGETYTVFLGGTHADFLGVAKVMNMHHIEFACQQGLRKVDFLCGDFHWKKLWHLDPEPLYKFVSPSLRFEEKTDQALHNVSPHILMEERSAT